ncbi:MAG TPA: NAD(P)-dependent oxidoreductase, partial [Caulobacteraceae bacterium]|nr:NAD(P)-dependent oxidoreductase [Caulobacteraceae bacterium]
MDAFPAFFPLDGRKVVVAGSGEAARAKARLFDGSPAELVRIEGEAAFEPTSYRDALLAFIAVEPQEAERAARAAARAGAIVNVVDRPDLCDFTTPAIVDRGEVVAAIGTGGASPMLATMLRSELEARVPQGIGRVAALFRQLQEEVREGLPDLTQRRAFLREALHGEAARAAMDGEMERAARLLRDSLTAADAAKGEVLEIDASGPADLVTLRTLRALGAADLLVVEPGANPDIVAMARRDAERVDGVGDEELRALIAAGKR